MVTLPGDVWLLGKHRLICGDSTNAEDVERVLTGVKPHLCVCDPPYGVSYDPHGESGSAMEKVSPEARCSMTTAPTGGKHGRCFREM
ncbi:hypothetical protein [Mesorhizobium sp.]|uniref:hypothetical protein n=1 Tax=Mesorhizobium sp. TaxID=1871066 RepID=UPI00258065E3|nr:hypothetical protein [Mesorhizobium sp.]